MEISFIHSQILVHLHVDKINFHMKGFALGLALKQRRKATRKSPIHVKKFNLDVNFFLILVLIIINLYQVVIGSEATLSVVGANGAVRYSGYYGNHGGAGGVIQILASSGLVASGSRLWLRKGNKTCSDVNEDSEDGFLLIKGARLIQIYAVQSSLMCTSLIIG